MSKSSNIPNAWDDDYETVLAQTQPVGAASQPTTQPRVTRAERKAKHAAENKQLWDSAENPQPFHFVETRSNDAPLKSDFKPAVQVLSRKPKPPQTLATGVGALNLGDDEDDSEEEARKAAVKDLAARQLKAKLEREEKQRKYVEARARLFGPGSSAADTNMNTIAARPSSSTGTTGSKSQPRRGGRRATAAGGLGGRDSVSASSSADQSPARNPTPVVRQLYDPDYTGRPGSVSIQKRGAASSSSSRAESPNGVSSSSSQQPIRLPKGPDGSGRGGFGFAARGGRFGNATDP